MVLNNKNEKGNKIDFSLHFFIVTVTNNTLGIRNKQEIAPFEKMMICLLTAFYPKAKLHY